MHLVGNRILVVWAINSGDISDTSMSTVGILAIVYYNATKYGRPSSSSEYRAPLLLGTRPSWTNSGLGFISIWMTWKPVWCRRWVWKGGPWWMRTAFWPWGNTSRESPSICKGRHTALVPGRLSEQKSWDPSLTKELVGKMKEWGTTPGSTWRWFSLSNNITVPRVCHGKDYLLSCVVIMT